MVNNTFEERNQEARLRERERGRECWREKISLELKGVCGRVRRVALLHLNHFHLTSSAWADLGQQLLQNPGRGVYSCVEPLSKPGTLFVGFLSFRYLLRYLLMTTIMSKSQPFVKHRGAELPSPLQGSVRDENTSDVRIHSGRVGFRPTPPRTT